MSYANFVQAKVDTAMTDSQTTVTLLAAVAPFQLPPTDGGMLSLTDSLGSPSNVEIIKYTSRSGLVLSGVTRAQEGTTARAWPSNSYCYQSLTAGDFAAQLAAKITSPSLAGKGGQVLKVNPAGTAVETGVGVGMVRAARYSNTMLVAADVSSLIDIQMGPFTQTFDAVATLGNGWFCYIQNNTAADITLDPNGAETIDGLASFIMYPGESRIIQCDGAALRSIVLQGFSKAFASSGNFIKPPGYKQFGGIMWSGGGSGRKGGTDAYGGTGSAGVPFTFPESAFTSSTALVIGSGGNPVTAANTSGSAGGTSTFMGLYCGPGAAGTTSGTGGGNAYKVSPTNTSLVGGLLNTSDSIYGGGGSRTNTSSTQYADTVYGGAAGGWIIGGAVTTAPSLTVFGGLGGAASLASSGSDGGIPGGGGGATQTGTQSGAGARGELRIWGLV